MGAGGVFVREVGCRTPWQLPLLCLDSQKHHRDRQTPLHVLHVLQLCQAGVNVMPAFALTAHDKML